MASNEPVSGWTKSYVDPRLRALIVGQLTFTGTINETVTNSYRLARARKQPEIGRSRATAHDGQRA